MKITLIAHKYSLKVKMLYITRHCLIFFCIQGLIRVLIYVTLSPKQTLFQWALFKGLSAIQCERWTTFHNTRSLFSNKARLLFNNVRLKLAIVRIKCRN